MSRKKERVFWPLLLAISTVVAFAFLPLRTRLAMCAVERTSSLNRMTNPVHQGALSADADQPRVEIEAGNVSPQSKDEQIEVEVLTLRRAGFDPATISRPRGRFLLAITNRTQAENLSLELWRESGNKLHEVKMARGRTRSLSDLNLPPGQYLLTETNHPTWTCRITMTPR